MFDVIVIEEVATVLTQGLKDAFVRFQHPSGKVTHENNGEEPPEIEGLREPSFC